MTIGAFYASFSHNVPRSQEADQLSPLIQISLDGVATTAVLFFPGMMAGGARFLGGNEFPVLSGIRVAGRAIHLLDLKVGLMGKAEPEDFTAYFLDPSVALGAFCGHARGASQEWLRSIRGFSKPQRLLQTGKGGLE